jgi:YlmC/YmxH family sporulation protein
MMCYYSELCYKEVIDIHTGFRLGYVCDVELDDREGCISSLVTPGRPRFFGLFGREEDYVLPWKNIVRVGSDIILVDVKGEFLRRKRQGKWF